jgi:hypothetical protein
VTIEPMLLEKKYPTKKHSHLSANFSSEMAALPATDASGAWRVRINVRGSFTSSPTAVN